ncbi:MAG: phage portal protein [Oscillospiraceae bacterium]|nr:phage portal protein [Oscillospiraceae bacterium]
MAKATAPWRRSRQPTPETGFEACHIARSGGSRRGLQIGSSAGSACFRDTAPDALRFPAAEAALYRQLRESVPIIDAAVFRLVRLLGGFRVTCENEPLEKRLNEALTLLPVGGNQWGVHAFAATYFEQLLTYGTALGELILREDGAPAALWNAPLEGVALRRAADQLSVEVCTGAPDRLRSAPYPELVYLSVLNPDPGALTGNSLLKGLPFVSGVLLSILDTLGQNWERLGNVRFAVTYNPGSDPAEKSRANERTKKIAEEWASSMREGAGIRDFIASGDVKIQVIGADAPMPDSEIPMRQLMEQIVAKTGLPPFLLGLTWSSTERMSAQQADLLTSELEAYRRILTPILLRICQTVLRLWGEPARCGIVWDDITLADEVELSRAALLRAQAENIQSVSHAERKED